MIKRLKQVFCNHFYFTSTSADPFYISDGDEFHDRRSIHYYHICRKCDKKIDSVLKWNHDDMITSMRSKS